MREEDSLLGMMMNIEGYVQALEGFIICSRKQQLNNKGLPENCQDLFKRWSDALQRIDSNDARLETPKKLLEYLVGKMAGGRPITNLPSVLSEAILSQETRDRYCEDMARNNPQGVLALTNGIHKLHDIVDLQTREHLNKGKPTTFKRKPVFDINREDFEELQPALLKEETQLSRKPPASEAEKTPLASNPDYKQVEQPLQSKPRTKEKPKKQENQTFFQKFCNCLKSITKLLLVKK